MSFKKTYAFIRGTWDGTPGSSNFVQDADVFASTEEFLGDYVPDADIAELVDEYVNSGDIINRSRDLSADGKVKINTTEFIDEAAHDAYAVDARWAAEAALTKAYDVELAAAPEDVNTFDEPGRIYYHSSAHLF